MYMTKLISLAMLTTIVLWGAYGNSTIFPKVNPQLNPNQKKYRGLNKKPEVMRQYMIDRMRIYVPLYFKEFKRLNSVPEGVLPTELSVIGGFYADIKSIPAAEIFAFAKHASDYQKYVMDGVVSRYLPKGTSTDNSRRIREMEKELKTLTEEVQKIKNLDLLARAEEVNRLSERFKKINFNLGTIGESLRGLSAKVNATSQFESTSSTSLSSSGGQSVWISYAALILSLLAVLLGSRKKN